MDVGLNNRNTLGEIHPDFADVVFFVESNNNEQMQHWSEYSKDSMSNIKSLPEDFINSLPQEFKTQVKHLNDKVKRFERTRVDWKQVMSGFGITIGHIKKMPVHVSFSFAIINGKKICFYDCTSRMADHTMVEDWLISRFQLTNDGYERWNHTNSSNFHNCVSALDRLDKEPRNTIYKKP
jgi:hypothetical protein